MTSTPPFGSAVIVPAWAGEPSPQLICALRSHAPPGLHGGARRLPSFTCAITEDGIDRLLAARKFASRLELSGASVTVMAPVTALAPEPASGVIVVWYGWAALTA